LTDRNTLSIDIIDFVHQDAITTALKKRHVDTVISILFLVGPDEWKIEQNLLNAAVAAGARRFAPSNFAGPVEEYVLRSSIHFLVLTWICRSHPFRAYEWKRRIMALLPEAPISWTHFTPGKLIST
jgi:hypothetical protein